MPQWTLKSPSSGWMTNIMFGEVSSTVKKPYAQCWHQPLKSNSKNECSHIILCSMLEINISITLIQKNKLVKFIKTVENMYYLYTKFEFKSFIINDSIKHVEISTGNY